MTGEADSSQVGCDSAAAGASAEVPGIASHVAARGCRATADVSRALVEALVGFEKCGVNGWQWLFDGEFIFGLTVVSWWLMVGESDAFQAVLVYPW